MKERIVVNGQDLKLAPNGRVNLNLRINDIGNISDRNSSFSNTISIPNISHNREIFDGVGIMGSRSSSPYTKVPCQYLQDGITIIREGYLQITDINEEEIKIVLYEGVLDLAQSLEGLYLKDLGLLTQYNHTLTDAVYLASFSKTDGYVYCYADFGVDTLVEPASGYPVEYQPPSLYAHNIFEDILTEAGYTFEGNIFSDADYLSLLAAPTNGTDVTITPPTITTLSTYDTGSLDEDVIGDISSESYDLTFILNTLTNAGISLNDANTVSVDFTGALEVTMSSTYQVEFGSINCVVRKNGNPILNFTSDSETLVSGEERSTTIQVTSGDIITYQVTGIKEVDTDIADYRLQFSLDNLFTFKQVAGGQNVVMSELFGEFLQSNFIKEIMQRYALIVAKDTFDPKKLIFKTMDELISEKSLAEDWTSKLVKIKNTNYAVQGYAKVNYLNHKYDKDIEVFDFDGMLEVDNEHLEKEKNLLTSISTIRNVSFTVGGENVYLVPLYEIKKVNGTDTRVPKKAGITLFKKNTVAATIDYSISGVDLSTLTNIPFIGFTDVSYQYYVDNYYQGIKSLLDNNKRLPVEVYLTKAELAELDFLRLKYLKQTGKYYYLNSVRSRGGVSTAELIEINN